MNPLPPLVLKAFHGAGDDGSAEDVDESPIHKMSLSFSNGLTNSPSHPEKSPTLISERARLLVRKSALRLDVRMIGGTWIRGEGWATNGGVSAVALKGGSFSWSSSIRTLLAGRPYVSSNSLLDINGATMCVEAGLTSVFSPSLIKAGSTIVA